MIIKSLLFSLTLLFSVTGFSQTFDININGKPGGLSGKLAETVAQVINQSNDRATVNYLGNCKIGERLYSTESNRAWIMNLGTSVYGSCQFDIKPHNLVDILYAQTWAVCYRKDRPELGPTHFLDQNQSKLIMTIQIVKTVVDSWVSDLGLNKSKVVAIGRSTDVLAASFGREGDYFVIDSTNAIEQQDRLSCLFNTGKEKLSGLNAPTLNEFGKGKIRYPMIYSSQILVLSGDSPQVSRWKSAIASVQKTEIWRKTIQRPGIEVIEVGDSWKFFEDQRKVFVETAASISKK